VEAAQPDAPGEVRRCASLGKDFDDAPPEKGHDIDAACGQLRLKTEIERGEVG